jgi:transposase-like protein
MRKKQYSGEQIIRLLRQAEVILAGGGSIGKMCKELGISDATYYKWRKEYGGMQVSQVKRLKELELENTRLKRAVADLTLSNLILKDVAAGN